LLYEGPGYKFLEYRALCYIFRLCYSGPLKNRWQSNSHFREWLPLTIGLLSEWRATLQRLYGSPTTVSPVFQELITGSFVLIIIKLSFFILL
jgi:hypothetical protein